MHIPTGIRGRMVSFYQLSIVSGLLLAYLADYLLLDTLYRCGWDIFDHGYAHLTGAGVNAAAEIADNGRVVEERTGVSMTQFVVPGGKDDPIGQDAYATAAFATTHAAGNDDVWGISLRFPDLRAFFDGKCRITRSSDTH